MATEKFTPEALSAMSALELDVIVAKMKGVSFEWGGTLVRIRYGGGVWNTDHKTEESAWGNRGAFVIKGAHPASDSNAASLLMDELVNTDSIEKVETYSTRLLTVVEVVSIFEGCDFTVSIEGRPPSQAQPRAITEAWILWKQSHTEETPHG